MTNQQQPEGSNSPKQAPTHRLLWSAITIFIILAIAGMWAIDFYYAPEMINPDTVPDAVGK